LVYILELTPDRLFVIHSDLNKLMGQADQPPESRKDSSTKRKTKPDVKVADKQQTASEIISDDSAMPMPNAEIENPNTKNAAANITSPLMEYHEIVSESSKSNHVILRIDEVEKRTGLSRSTIYDRLNQKSKRHDATFPKSISLGSNSVGWMESEINAWIESRSSRAIHTEVSHH
jgi:prophage regulatory protein